MDANEAWRKFTRSGKITDYLKYREIANEAEYRRIDNKRKADR